jgi:hypothetical protein
MGAHVMNDQVHHPRHYTAGRFEAIDVIEDAIQWAPTMPLAFFYGQVLKYLLRMWLKGNPKQDAAKARWYLDKLLARLDA